jgi:hypothetical protein
MATVTLKPSGVTNGYAPRLAKWIRRGWNRPEGREIQNSYLAYDNGEDRIVLHTLAFALIGKEESIDNGVKALERELSRSDDYIQALARVLEVPVPLIQRVKKLESQGDEGDLIGKAPLEIADILEREKG